MKRRDFLKTGTLVASGVMLLSVSFASKNEDQKGHNIFDITLKHYVKTAGKVTKLWLTLPLNSSYQSMVSAIKNSGNYDEIYQSDFKIPTLFAKFSKENPTITTNFKILTTDRTTDFSKVNFDENEKLSPEVAKFLEPTKSIQINGIVKQKSDEIVKGISGDLEKARAIYNWTANNMTRDESIIGCGLGDAKAILESGKLYGKCTDISSVFVALAREFQLEKYLTSELVKVDLAKLWEVAMAKVQISLVHNTVELNFISKVTDGYHAIQAM